MKVPPPQPGTKPPVVVYGAGGHGRVVADAAVAAGFEVLGFLDDGLPVGHEVLGWRVLGPLAWLKGRRDVQVAHGIGANAGRARATEALDRDGTTLATIIHPAAVVSPHARVGDGVVVMALAVLNPGARVGRGAIVNTGAIVEHDVTVGEFAHVASNAALAGGARLEAHALLGTGANVLPGRAIGPRSVVGAGAVVTRDVAADAVVAGVPARAIDQQSPLAAPGTPPRTARSPER
jgi:sugar O-acyltransferase (sialic acid O-acetyltransferase NeuD family)